MGFVSGAAAAPFAQSSKFTARGERYAATNMRTAAAALLSPRIASVSMRQQSLHELPGCLPEDAALVRIALQQRSRERLRLFERDMRRQRYDVGVGERFHHDGPLRGERLVPCSADLVRMI